MPNSAQLRSSVSTWMRESSSAIIRAAGRAVGWHVVVGGRHGLVRATDRATLDAQAVEGLRRGHLVHEVEVDVDQPVRDLVRVPDLVEHRLRQRHQLLRRPAATTASSSAGLARIVLEMVGEVSVEGDAVARAKLVALAVDDERRRPVQDHRGLAAARLVERRIARPARHGAGIKPVNGDVGALAGQWRSQLLDPVPAPAALAALSAADDHDVAVLVEAQQLGERQLQALCDPRRDGERRARLPPLDLREHRRAHPAALGQVAKREAHRLSQRSDPDADHRRIDGSRVGSAALFGDRDRHGLRTLSRTSVCHPLTAVPPCGRVARTRRHR